MNGQSDWQSWVVCEDREVWLQKKWIKVSSSYQTDTGDGERERQWHWGCERRIAIESNLTAEMLMLICTDNRWQYEISNINFKCHLFHPPSFSNAILWMCVCVSFLSLFFFFLMPVQSHNIWKHNLTLIFLKNIRQALWSLSVRKRWNSEWWLLMEMRWLQSLTTLSRLKWSGWFPEENVIAQNLLFHSWGDLIEFSFMFLLGIRFFFKFLGRNKNRQ